MKKLLFSAAMLVLLGQGCAQAPVPESSEQNMPPQEQEDPAPSLPRGSSTYNIAIQDFAFVQPTITVKKGDKVIFQNRDTVGHSVTADGGAFDSKILQGGQSFTLDTTKLAPGAYPYHCAPHPFMTGTVIVE